MDYKNILFEVKDDGVGLLTVNRPKSLNALNPETLDEISDVIDRIEKEQNVKVLVITGAGEKAFIAGADITEFPKMNALQAYIFAEKGQRLFFRLEKLPIPVIACVNGFALGGGCELAMSGDFIYASDKAKFGRAEINLGIIPGFGGTQRLSRLVGRAKAKELCMTGEMISAEEAKAIGLVAKVFPADKLLEETLKIASDLAKKSQIAIRAIKRVIDEGVGMDLRSGCELEANAFAMTFTSEDAREGVAAFLEKRKPSFKGGFSA
ncbi:MAG TPA: enoyl-CoA hydratase/isomerase family protein [Thermodesulforhabdus norvegica]|uniref:Enoyl-CoA hydratase/isomerase family protein n=1 Tax=Thermodesulforhabdus norvegica TaxID=39841 RepID=A0A7C1AV81_9BACT|nr:enoyl-CoA hydratase/isomerase family protein [Thermodesulforhabdus norvegica]